MAKSSPIAPASGPRTTLLLRLLDQAFDQKAWHGPTLKGALRGVTAAEAAFRPGPGRHTIWELAVHAAYWKYTVWRQLTGAERGTFPLKGSNWFPRPTEATEAAWKADQALLAQCHADLRTAVAALPEAALDTQPAGSKYPIRELVLGIASHDLYHAGQISLIKRLAAGKGR